MIDYLENIAKKLYFLWRQSDLMPSEDKNQDFRPLPYHFKVKNKI